MKWRATLLTIFPEMFPGPLGLSNVGKALANDLWELEAVNIRDFATDKHGTVDDRPFGGGAGMVMRPDALDGTISNVLEKSVVKPKLIYPSPRGEVFTQKKVEQYIECEHIAILCGRYEGIDQRIIDKYDIEEVSLGDFVLSGGEIAAMAVIDACVRKIPGVLSNAFSCAQESFGGDEYGYLLEYPHYTRPAKWDGNNVPEVLISGDHAKVEAWRKSRSEEITEERRKDLWEEYKRLKNQEN